MLPRGEDLHAALGFVCFTMAWAVMEAQRHAIVIADESWAWIALVFLLGGCAFAWRCR